VFLYYPVFKDRSASGKPERPAPKDASNKPEYYSLKSEVSIVFSGKKCSTMLRSEEIGTLVELVLLVNRLIRQKSTKNKEKYYLRITPSFSDDNQHARPNSPVQVRLMAAAIQPAPKPLSILTTATPGAQLFNIPSSAAIPPKPVP